MREEIVGYASVRGEFHKKDNLPNQDAYLVKRLKTGTLIVVSDGMGSHAYSDIGSKAVCKAFSRALQIWNEKDCDDIRLLIPILHALWGLDIWPHLRNECGATCLFAYIDFRGTLYLGQLGDGSIYYDIGCGTCLLKDKEDDFTNLTIGVNNIKGYDDWCLYSFDIHDKKIKLCMMTDGVSETLVEEKKIDFVNLIWRRISQKSNIIDRNNMMFKLLSQWNLSNSGDDRTVVCYEMK